MRNLKSTDLKEGDVCYMSSLPQWADKRQRRRD